MSLPTSIPVRREPQGEGTAFNMDVIGFGLMAVLVLLLLGVWLKQKAGAPSSSRSQKPFAGWSKLFIRSMAPTVKVLSSTRLTPRHSLHEVNWQGRRLLIACAERSASVIGDIPMVAPEESATFNADPSRGAFNDKD